MAATHKIPIDGILPPSAYRSRLVERKVKSYERRLQTLRDNNRNEDFIIYSSSDDEDDDEHSFRNSKILRTSFNFVDYIDAKQFGNKMEKHTLDRTSAMRNMLTYEMLREYPIDMGDYNKVLCSSWLDNTRILFGTKCHKLLLYDLRRRTLSQVPCLDNVRERDERLGIHTMEINASRNMVATNSRFSSNLAVYSLPALKPLWIGADTHTDMIIGATWLDDDLLVTASRDAKLAVWRFAKRRERNTPKVVTSPLAKTCNKVDRIRCITYNKNCSELLCLSSMGQVYVWDAEHLRHVFTRKLATTQETITIATNEDGRLYAVGCKTYTIIVDSRCLQTVKKIQTRHASVRSVSFSNGIVTACTGCGILMFHDLRSGTYLMSNVNSTRGVTLRTSKGTIPPELRYNESGLPQQYNPAIYTHCYDPSGTKLFCAGGPIETNSVGCYAAVFQ